MLKRHQTEVPLLEPMILRSSHLSEMHRNDRSSGRSINPLLRWVLNYHPQSVLARVGQLRLDNRVVVPNVSQPLSVLYLAVARTQ